VDDQILYEVRDHVAYVTINRPERRNALNMSATTDMIRRFSEAGEDPEVWAVLLTGAGDKAFCAGGDLKEFDELAKQGKRFPMPMTGPERNLFEVVLETYKPVVAAINGPVLAGGVITLLIPLVLVAPFMRHFRLSLLDGSTRG